MFLHKWAIFFVLSRICVTTQVLDYSSDFEKKSHFQIIYLGHCGVNYAIFSKLASNQRKQLLMGQAKPARASISDSRGGNVDDPCRLKNMRTPVGVSRSQLSTSNFHSPHERPSLDRLHLAPWNDNAMQPRDDVMVMVILSVHGVWCICAVCGVYTGTHDNGAFVWRLQIEVADCTYCLRTWSCGGFVALCFRVPVILLAILNSSSIIHLVSYSSARGLWANSTPGTWYIRSYTPGIR